MIKQWLLPVRDNNYHPYILRPFAFSIILSLIVLQPLLYNLTTVHKFHPVSYATDVTSNEILSLTNQQRSSNGIASLRDNAQLDQAAQAKATDMFAKNYWAHNSPTGATPWSFILDSGYQYSAAAENLAMDFLTSNAVLDAWMGSTEHRTNILNGAYSDVGIAVLNGTLQGEQTTLVVAMYAAPLHKVAPVVSHTSTPTPTATPAATPASHPVSAPPAVTPPATSSPPTPSPNTSHTTGTAPVVVAPASTVEKPVALSFVSRLKHIDALNWGQKASVLLLGTLILAEVLKHTVVWRKQKRGWRHIWLRSHPAFQASLLAIILIVVVVSGYGTII